MFAGESTGTAACVQDKHASAKQRYSIRLTAPEDVNGRQTAARMDAYFTESTRGCPLADLSRGVVSWRGTRV